MEKEGIDQKSTSTNQTQKITLKEIKKEKDLLLDDKFLLYFDKKLGSGA